MGFPSEIINSRSELETSDGSEEPIDPSIVIDIPKGIDATIFHYVFGTTGDVICTGRDDCNAVAIL